ncbi:MAG TPA: hypothetical protein VGN09_15075, partial [Vicinamibacteria bacterium]
PGGPGRGSSSRPGEFPLPVFSALLAATLAAATLATATALLAATLAATTTLTTASALAAAASLLSTARAAAATLAAAAALLAAATALLAAATLAALAGLGGQRTVVLWITHSSPSSRLETQGQGAIHVPQRWASTWTRNLQRCKCLRRKEGPPL